MKNYENWLNLTHRDPYSKEFDAALSASDLEALVETIIEICTDECRENPTMKLFRIKAICKEAQSKLEALFADDEQPEGEENDGAVQREVDLVKEALSSSENLKWICPLWCTSWHS